MSSRRNRIDGSLWLLLVAACCSVGLGRITVEPRYETVAPGVEYSHNSLEQGPWSIHIARISRDRDNLRFVSTLAEKTIYGLASVGKQIETLGPDAGKPVVAVNADFFRIRLGPYQGDPTGLHITDGELTSSPIGTSFWIDARNRPHIAEVMAKLRATAGDLNIPLGLNQPRDDDKAVLYSPSIGLSTRTKGGLELILEKTDEGSWLPLRPSRQYLARVAAISRTGNTYLSPSTMALSIGPELLEGITVPAEGSTLTISTKTVPDLEGVRTAVAGGPILIADGKARQWSGEQPRHPRTMVGFNEEYYFLVVVDGRQPELSVGMTNGEMAELMSSLGCTDAMNLDGGGSSTFWLKGKVMNSPSDGRPRSVANALILVNTNHKLLDTKRADR